MAMQFSVGIVSMAGRNRIKFERSDAFLSYSRDNDLYLMGDITWLRGEIERAVQAFTGVPFKIFQDKVNIRHGKKWEKALNVALEDAQLFIPILSPSFFESDHCQREAEAFLDYERRSGRDDLIFPIRLIGWDLPEHLEKKKKGELEAKLLERQLADWREFRLKLKAPETRPCIEKFAMSLAIAATRPDKRGKWTDIFRIAGKAGVGRKQVIGIDTSPQSRAASPSDHSNRSVDPHHGETEPRGNIHVQEYTGAEEASPCEPISIRPEHQPENPEGRARIHENEIEPSHGGLASQMGRWRLVVGLCFVASLIAASLLWFYQNKELTPGEVLAGIKGPPETETVEPPPGKGAEATNPLPVAVDRQEVSEAVPSRAEAVTGTSQQSLDQRAAASSSNQPLRDCSYCPEMVFIPVGTFSMGSPENEDQRYNNEGPLRDVTIDRPFELGKYEVTRAEFGLFVSRTGYEATGCAYHDGEDWVDDQNLNWRDPGYEQTGDDPVVCVNWEDAKAYVSWLSEETGETYRLPSEAEWEYAARAGSSTSYFWGDDTGRACVFSNGHDETSKKINGLSYSAFPCDDGRAKTAPVGSFRPNNFGLHDMTGNVWEWVEDTWHDNYVGAPTDGRAWVEANDRLGVLRGGAWRYNPRSLRSATRRKADQDNRIPVDGFRVAKTLGR